MANRRKSTTPTKRADNSSIKKRIRDPFMIGSRKFKVSQKTLKFIEKMQTTTALCIPRSSFGRLVREIMTTVTASQDNLRIQVSALEGLQESAELYLTQLFEDANKCAYHGKRVTLKLVDIQLVRTLRGEIDDGS